MKIRNLIDDGKPEISFEIFPPKKDAPAAPVKEAVRRLAELKPSFISVTYGAGGGANVNTADVASFVQDCGVPALAHLTCLSSTRARVEEEVAKLAARGVSNILCLRGDCPPGMAPADMPGDFAHAVDLVRFLDGRGFCLGGACYPECHPECAHIADDLAHIKEKVDAGLDFLVSQMFFDNNIFYAYLSKLLGRGIRVPVLAGIMPVTNAKQIARICQLSGSFLPARFKAIVDRFGDDPASMTEAGIAYATEQIIDLFANGVNGVHVYTMNKPDIAERIMGNLKCILGR
mgnify:FL=1